MSPISSQCFLDVTAQTDKGENDILEAGDFIAYRIDVSNTGNTCLQTLAIADLLVGPSISCNNSGTGVSITHCNLQ